MLIIAILLCQVLKFYIYCYRTVPLHDSNQILAVKLAAYNKNIDEVRNWYKTEHMNFKVIDGERSKWWVWNTTLEFSRESVRQIQTYLQRISDGKTVCNRADINKNVL